jgi:hypothetical protein
MKGRTVVTFVACLFVATALATSLSASSALANDKFMVIASHTPEDCLKVLDDMSGKSSKLLSKFDWGCMAGDHTAYAVFDAKDEAAVKAMLPDDMKNAKIVKLNKFTAAQIKSFHEKK